MRSLENADDDNFLVWMEQYISDTHDLAFADDVYSTSSRKKDKVNIRKHVCSCSGS